MLRAGLSMAVRCAAAVSAGPSPPVQDSCSALRPLYPTEGGSVPVYSMLHGRVQRRNWVTRSSEWCDLCNEPIASWLNHIGRKDHALLDLHYSQMMEWRRRWDPQSLITAFQEHLGLESITPLQALMSYEEQQHRHDTYALLVKLEEEGMLYFGEPKDTFLSLSMGGLRGMDHQGALLMHECLVVPFVRLYPEAHIQDYSNLTDFITCAYNMETVYDLLGLYKLDKVAVKAQFGPSSPAAMGLGGIATSSSATFGYMNEDTTTTTTAAAAAAAAQSGRADGSASAPASTTRQAQLKAAIAEREREAAAEDVFSRKAAFVRQILGQLRWLMDPEQTHPAGYTFPEHVVTLGELCIKMLMTQIIGIRVSEYMVRVEPVWHNFGFERRREEVMKVAKNGADIVPRSHNHTHRTRDVELGDLYSCTSTALDDYVVRALAKKKLAAPPEFTSSPEHKQSRRNNAQN